MCGIAVVAYGMGCLSSPLQLDAASVYPCFRQSFCLSDVQVPLRRRGPDSFNSKEISICDSVCIPRDDWDASFSAVKDTEQLSDAVSTDNVFKKGHYLDPVGEKARLPAVQLHFMAATLQLRGNHPITQPFADSYDNFLLFNGEIYGGIDVLSDANDGEVLLLTLERSCPCNYFGQNVTSSCTEKGHKTVPDVLSSIKGPWAVIYWQECTKTLWFGRDAFGRRSLLVHWPAMEDDIFALSSVLNYTSIDQRFKPNYASNQYVWEELPCGIYSLTINASEINGSFPGVVKRHEWTNPDIMELIKWERACIHPAVKDYVSPCLNMQSHSISSSLGHCGMSVSASVQSVLNALRNSVMLRTPVINNSQLGICGCNPESTPVAVLFSGGLDSMILAILLHLYLDPLFGIDLLNISFDEQSAPDRISAKAGLEELRVVAPSRRWKLVEIDADLTKISFAKKHIMSLIYPACTYMDLNIGVALWMASSGDGWVRESDNCESFKYKSTAKVLFVGSGADEQCAGYGRHKTKYRSQSWAGLNEEMKVDMQRIWKRNMGRDDRCISDHGKEARYPFLDEDVIRVLLNIPLWEIADLDKPSGEGDKMILREVARALGLHKAAAQPKRAIQFGSRIARESNKMYFGSNRAANQASAGTRSVTNNGE